MSGLNSRGGTLGISKWGSAAGTLEPLRGTILDKIKWNRKPPSPPPPQIKDEGARRAKTRHFPILDLGGRGGLGFPFILSKIVVQLNFATLY